MGQRPRPPSKCNWQRLLCSELAVCAGRVASQWFGSKMHQALGGLKVRVPIEYDEVAACSRGKQSNAFKMQPPLLTGNRHMELHSAVQFGKQRDFWWHRDFLDLMALRWKLADASSIADIGCGLGHWSRLLYRYLKAPG